MTQFVAAFVSDSVPIWGYRRVPYFIFSLVLQATGWAALGLVPSSIGATAALRLLTLLTEAGDQFQVHLKNIRSFYAAGERDFFHVHPELVETDADTGCLTVCLCDTCSKAAAATNGRAPASSIAGGCDYGLLTRLGLELPSALETLGLADVRLYSLTAKVHVPGQWCAA